MAHTDIVSASFPCGTCAGEIRATLLPSDREIPPGPWSDGVSLFRRQFPGGSAYWIENGPVSISFPLTVATGIETVSRLLDVGDAPGLYSLDRELASFWCPDCGACYCKAHWTVTVAYDDDFYDCTYGDCPQGHHRVLDD